ncbi:tRNA (guanosine(37)-N1)-methyltransferase TrmD [Geomicrobium sp. JCM 19039]|uniref:tRNA (guanosine(37)-N1)-methyltransferase TrmD n=1 Tax=Geomicrobium sp. JCM 19039 TaxID=1460636 RepID=UPI00045F1CF4|nr:tRNA (guanosine(37)-N1)-methyltransferase TrmD [Geomicrobium sp. JCM 19039]GAK10894.1 tRNA (guanine37-N1) -methyltransferase [Geomicrobium sp. JCM 19039]
MNLHFLTLFPEMFTGVKESSIWKQANDKGSTTYTITNFRDYTDNKHKKVDDYPFGGGAGMVLRAQPIHDALQAIPRTEKERVVLLCPQGEAYTQKKAEELADSDQIVFICGHYEGYDERIRTFVTDEISVGDYVLTGGELASMIVADSVIRLQPGVLGNDESAVKDSFSTGLLEHPQYTRPAEWNGLHVPEVLLSGHHERIHEWREKEALKRTWQRRPDLLEQKELSEREHVWIKEFEGNN